MRLRLTSARCMAPLALPLLLLGCGGSQQPANASAAAPATSSIATSRAKERARSDAAPTPKNEGTLPWSIEGREETVRSEAPPTSIDQALARDRFSLELRLDVAAVRATAIKDAAAQLVDALPTTPTLFSQGGLSTIDTLDALFVGTERARRHAFFVLARARGGSATFQSHANRAGIHHGTPLTWTSREGTRHTVFSDPRGADIALALWDSQHISISRAQALDELQEVARTTSSLVKLPPNVLLLLELIDARGLTGVDDKRIPRAVLLRVLPDGRDFKVEVDAGFDNEDEARDAFVYYTNERDKWAKHALAKLIYGKVLANLRFEHDGATVRGRAQVPSHVLRQLLSFLSARMQPYGKLKGTPSSATP